MFARIRKSMEQKDQGFTLIELLVVMIIIGILAAIAIPSFLGQRDKANDSRAKADVRTAQTAMETYYTDDQNYTGATNALLREIEPSLPTTVTVNVIGPQEYSVTQTADGTATAFTIARSAGGVVTRSCDPAGAAVTKGGCKNSTW